ncbi:MAG: HD domain-containing protein [Clostridia bacterium]|nr:HD domain-containing protein [Clostridia bacterium]
MNNKLDSSNYKILAVENGTSIQDALKKMVRSSKYSLTEFKTLKSALKEIDSTSFDILILDFSTITESKLEMLKSIREKDENVYIILLINSQKLTIPLKDLKALSVQGYCEKDDKLEQLPLFVEAAVKSIDQMKIIKNINDELIESKEKLEKAYLESIETLRYTVEAKDRYTHGHSDRVSAYSVLIGKKLGLSNEDLNTLKIGGLFHDIGKIGISDAILLKNGKLTDAEYSEIKNHPVIGKNILSNAAIFENIIPIVLYHHERYDGKGYPYGLQDSSIPFLARIVSVADSFDAMTSRRSYRGELDLEYVKNEFKTKSGTQFDPVIAQIFLDILNTEYHLIAAIKRSH